MLKPPKHEKLPDFAAPRCQQCGGVSEFGYRRNDGSMRWFCGEHRLAQFWADARMPSGKSTGNGLPEPLDKMARNRPTGGVDDQLLFRPAGQRSRPEPIAVDRTPHFTTLGASSIPAASAGAMPILALVWICAPATSVSGSAPRAKSDDA